jgi:hypothetical protein
MKRCILLTALCALPLTSAGQSRTLMSEGEIAGELLGLVANESGCPTYAVAWIDRVTQQVRAQCAEEIREAQQIAAKSGARMRVLVDIVAAKAEKKSRRSNLTRSAAVLAHLLTSPNTFISHANGGAPILIFWRPSESTPNSPRAAQQHPSTEPEFIF